MDYFDDLEFVNGGFAHASSARTENRLFEGYYGIQFIREGEIFVQVEGSAPWQASGPVVFFTAPGKKFTYFSPHGTREHLYLCFKGPRVQRYISGGLIAEPGKKLAVTAPEELVKRFSAVFLTLRKRNFTSRGEAVLNLERLLLCIAGQPKSNQAARSFHDVIKKLEDEIAAAPGENWNFAEIAAKHHVSEVHFRRLFVNETGVPPWKFVMNCRIRYACQLLHSPELLIKEIAGECGFASEANFSRQFHKIMKTSPENFKKTI